MKQNQNQPIGLVIATNMEFDAFLKIAEREADTISEIHTSTIKAHSFHPVVHKSALPFDRVYEMIIGEQRIIAVHTSESIRRATRAVDYLSWCHHPKMIINFGTAGALKSEINSSGIYLVKNVVQSDFDISGGLTPKQAKRLHQDYFAPGQHSNYDTPYLETDQQLRQTLKSFAPDITEVTVASSNKFVFGEDKQQIIDIFDADIAEMEAAGILLTCNEEHIPTLILKCISDGVDASASEYYKAATNVSEACSAFVINFIKFLDTI